MAPYTQLLWEPISALCDIAPKFCSFIVAPLGNREKWKKERVLVIESCPALVMPPARLLCPWNSPDKNTGVGWLFQQIPHLQQERRKLNTSTSLYIWVQSPVRPLSRAPGVSRTMGVFLEIMSTQCKEPVSGSVRHVVKPWNLCADGKCLLQLAASP